MCCENFLQTKFYQTIELFKLTTKTYFPSRLTREREEVNGYTIIHKIDNFLINNNSPFARTNERANERVQTHIQIHTPKTIINQLWKQYIIMNGKNIFGHNLNEFFDTFTHSPRWLRRQICAFEIFGLLLVFIMFRYFCSLFCVFLGQKSR